MSDLFLFLKENDTFSEYSGIAFLAAFVIVDKALACKPPEDVSALKPEHKITILHLGIEPRVHMRPPELESYQAKIGQALVLWVLQVTISLHSLGR